MWLRSNSLFFYYVVAMTKIYIHLSGTLQHLITLTGRGYVHHVTGIIKPAKVEHLSERFKNLYETELSKHQVARRKKAGKCNVKFVIHPRYTTPDFQWWLLATKGEGAFHEREKSLCSTLKRQRLRAFNQYEAIKLPNDGKPPSWTWRLTKESYLNWRARIQAAIRNRRDEKDIKNVLRELHSLPGFRGIRSQVAELRKFAGGEWRRITAQNSCPHIPKSVQPYLRFKTYKTVDAELVVDRIKAGKSPYALKWKYGDKNE